MGGYRRPIDPLEATYRRAEERERATETSQATTATACRCVDPKTYFDEDGDKRCLCGRAARS
jgi:hypothetical protein